MMADIAEDDPYDCGMSKTVGITVTADSSGFTAIEEFEDPDDYGNGWNYDIPIERFETDASVIREVADHGVGAARGLGVAYRDVVVLVGPFERDLKDDPRVGKAGSEVEAEAEEYSLPDLFGKFSDIIGKTLEEMETLHKEIDAEREARGLPPAGPYL